jgi:pyrroline-5-carboxylate reductase
VWDVTQVDFPSTLWLIGCGNMAGAMLRRWLEVGLDPAAATVIRPSGLPVAQGVRVVTQPPQGQAPAVALLGIKPQKLDEAAPAYRDLLGSDTTIISILAGVELASLRERFPHAGAIIRAMPNTPVALGKGATALCGDQSARGTADNLMRALGTVEWVDEGLFDIVTALTASGPAFVFRFVDALAAGAAALGLPSQQAQRLAVATVEGAAALAAAVDESPHQLAERVASPGGTTREGLNVLDADDALDRLVQATLDAARRRSREMGEAARRA